MRKLLIGLWCISAVAGAQEVDIDPRIDAALELLEAMQVKSQMELMRESIKPMLQQQMSSLSQELGEEISAEQQAVMDRYMAKIADVSFSPRMLNELMLDAAAAYADVFTLEEMSAISDFYRSPAGISMLEKTPQVTQQMMQLTMESQQTVMADIARLTQDMTEELKAIAAGDAQ